MNKEVYLVFEYDYERIFNEYATDDLDDAVDRMLSFEDEPCIVIKVFKDRKLDYTKGWAFPFNNFTKQEIIETINNRL